MRVLVVEDEPKMANVIAKGLREQSYAVDVAPDGDAGSLPDVNQRLRRDCARRVACRNAMDLKFVVKSVHAGMQLRS